jgi:hypothetical protein
MCGGGSSQYDAFKSGDFENWNGAFQQRADIETKLAKGEIDQATADAQLAALGDLSTLENKIKSDASAGMEMRETTRQHDVGLGRIGIDKAFSKFDDDYYKGYQDDYTGFYFPQLDRQYGKAVDKTTAALAQRGVLESTIGANKFGDLARQNTEARTGIAGEALDASNKLRGTVENSKSSLYSLNEASANPQAVNAQAIGQATSLVAPPTYSPLGQVFADAFAGLNNYAQARQNRPTRGYQSPYQTSYGSGQVFK